VVRRIHNGDGVLTIRFSPDGKTIATGNIPGDVDFWDPTNGRRVGRTLGGQNGYVVSVSFSPDGRELATTSGDGHFRLWDIASGKLVGAPLPGADAAGWGGFFPDGRNVIAAFASGLGVEWDLNPSDWERHACLVAHSTLTRAEWHDIAPERPYRRVCA
jgi:WD40 repeat protein